MVLYRGTRKIPERETAGVLGFRRRRARTGISLTAPALAALAATMLYPIGWTIWLSVNSSKTALRGTPDFVGLANYVKIAANRDFRTALYQTIGIVAASAVLEALLGLIVALALHRALAGTRIFRAIVALPLMVAPVVGALAWRFMFADGYGLIDTIAAAPRRRGAALVRQCLARPRHDRHRQSVAWRCRSTSSCCSPG